MQGELEILRPDRRGVLRWVIDGLDECEHAPGVIWKRIVRAVSELPADTHRRRLRLLMLSRDRDWLTDLEDELRPHYGALGADAPLVVRMAPVDRQEAARLLGTADLRRVVGLIERFGLEGISGYPRVLTHLRGWRGEGELTEDRVWRDILADLLQEHDHHKKGRYRSAPEERFEAVSRLAAVSLLAGEHELVDGSRDRAGLFVNDVFPLGPAVERARALRQAAGDAVRIGEPFRGTPDGGYRFAQRNIRDWFCAFGLSGLSRGRLEAVITDGNGPLHHLVDMLRLLKRVSRDDGVRAWLTASLAR